MTYKYIFPFSKCKKGEIEVFEQQIKLKYFPIFYKNKQRIEDKIKN